MLFFYYERDLNAMFPGLLLYDNVQRVLCQEEPKLAESGVMQPLHGHCFAKLVPGLEFRFAGIPLLFPGSFPLQ